MGLFGDQKVGRKMSWSSSNSTYNDDTDYGKYSGPSTFDDDEDEPLFPSLKQRSAEDRSREIVDELKEMILNPGRDDGKSGMSYLNWSRHARKEITKAIRDAETSASLRELMSAKRVGGMCMRIAFLLFAAVASFAAFWWGIFHIGRIYGPMWGFAATTTAVGLAFAFIICGLVLSGDDIDKEKKKVKEKFDLD